MADWYNLRLAVTGLPPDVQRFRRAAGALKGRIDTRRSDVFTQAMEHGETMDLEAEAPVRFHDHWKTVTYRFQGRYTDHVDNLRPVSGRFPTLAFVLTYGDAMDSHGSYFLVGGAIAGHWDVPKRRARAIFRSNYLAHGLRTWKQIYADYDEAYWAEAEAGDEAMDLAARHWDVGVARWLRTGRIR